MIQIVIEMDDTGQVKFNSNASTRVLTYGLLEIAREIVITQAIKQSENRVEVAPPGLFVPRN